MVNIEWYWHKDLYIDHWNRIQNAEIDIHMLTCWKRLWCWERFTNSMDMNLSRLQEIVEETGAWCAAVHGVSKSRTWLSEWTTTKCIVSDFQLVAKIIKWEIILFSTNHDGKTEYPYIKKYFLTHQLISSIN